eukprot:6173552-Pleurochrysis_carterae.AAC.1
MSRVLHPRRVRDAPSRVAVETSARREQQVTALLEACARGLIPAHACSLKSCLRSGGMMSMDESGGQGPGALVDD